jgi:hypothetical protein
LYEQPLESTGQARLWATLEVGSRVELIHHGGHSQTGVLDEVTTDRTTLWIQLDHGMGRIFITEGDPVALVPYG